MSSDAQAVLFELGLLILFLALSAIVTWLERRRKR